MAHSLEIRRLGKSYSGTAVLGPIDLSLEAGTITAIIGKSGCGKTTLLRCLGALETPDAGIIKIGGGRVNARDIGVVLQEPRLMPWLTVEQNVGFGLARRHRNARQAAIAEALEIVGLPDARHLLPKQLSGGMAQRVALARLSTASRTAVAR